MSSACWIAFTLAYTLMAVAPGPVILLVVSYAMAEGRRTAFAVVAGTTLGDASCLTAAVLGLGAVLAASATLFTVLKLAGAAYLVFLGVRMWRRPALPRPEETVADGRKLWRVFAHAYVSTVLNPKSVLFFMIFVPQFLDPKARLLPQLGAMLASVLICGTTVDAGYSLFASTLRRFTRSERAQRAVGRVTGSLLIGEGVVAAASRAVTL